uniref:Uncharacterized protein n=1 Tax=Leersia perrieri TaxID=77586 RepID=A0A0D9V523_9ORYZ
MRATAHHPSMAPPTAHHLDALVAFGRGSRLSASVLTDRLRPRILLSRDAFILRDQLVAALVRHPASGRNPLALPASHSADPSPRPHGVRFSARLLELILLLPDGATDADYLTALPNSHLTAELAAFASDADALRHAPSPSTAPQENTLVWELIRLTEEDRAAAERNIATRV